MRMKLCSKSGREELYIGSVYMPTESTSICVVDSCYERLKEDVLNFKEKENIVFLGYFNARTGRYLQIDNVIGMFGENICNSNRNLLIYSFE